MVLRMQQINATFPQQKLPCEQTLAFYREVLIALNQASIPHLVGGAYALSHYTGINRLTHDFDLFIDRMDYERIAETLSDIGCVTELTFPHWLAKTHFNGDFIDLIFGSGNGVAEVDRIWFEHAVPAELFGVPTMICPVEETIWSKAYIMERERFDGADVAHLLLAEGATLDWPRLLQRFGPHWRLLLSHLTLFGFIYPAHRAVVPSWVMESLLARFAEDCAGSPDEQNICGGTLLSREQYLNDVNLWGYQDARIAPLGRMSPQDASIWTEAINRED